VSAHGLSNVLEKVESAMKKDIHPEYKQARITCVCGNVIETRSTKGDYDIQICSKCHPFFTGKQKLVDTAGRVERFKRRYAGYGGQPAAEPAADSETSSDDSST